MEKIKIAVSGVGNRALPKNAETSNWYGWVELIRRSTMFELVGAHDVSEDSCRRIVEQGYLNKEQTFQDLDEMLKNTPAEALLITNPAQFHASTIEAALKSGLHCLVEKPFVDDLASGYKLLDLVKESGKKVMVIQNWRTKDVGRLMAEAVAEGMLGRVGHVFFRYVRDRENPNYPSYIFDEKYPLLYAMGIHHLDLLRYVLQDEFVSVQGMPFKAPWSLYRSATGLNLFLKTQKDISVVYTGTISSKNRILPQESVIIEGEKGSLVNDSQWLDPPLWFYPSGSKEKIELTGKIQNRSMREQYDVSDELILNNFYNAITAGEKMICSAEDGLRSIEVLEASRIACETNQPYLIDGLQVGV